MGNNWAPRYDNTQREAVIEACLTHGLNAREAADRAQAGTLPGSGRGLEPFSMPVTTARDLVGRRRRQQIAEQRRAMDPGGTVKSHRDRLLAIMDRELTRAERQSRNNRLDPAKLRELTRAGREIDALSRQLERGETSMSHQAPAKASKRESTDLIDTLAQEERPSRAAPQDAPTPTSVDRSEAAPRANTSANEKNDNRDEERQYLASKRGVELAGLVSQAAEMARQDP